MNGSLQQLAENLFSLAPRDRIKVVLSRCEYEGLENDPTSVLALCLDKGVDYAVRELLERESEIAELCRSLDIEVKDYEDRSVMIGKINKLYVEPRKPRGIRSILRFVDNSRSDSELLRHSAMDCFLEIESLIRDFYGMYIYCFLRRYLNADEVEKVENMASQRPVKTGNVVEQIIRYEKKVRNGDFPDFVEEIQKKNGQNSIFGGIRDEDLEIFSKIIHIRNEFLFHENDCSKSEIRKKTDLFFQFVESLFSKLVSSPLSIICVQHGVNEMGVHYIDFLGEDDCTRKFYLYESPVDFRPNEQAYCFHPTKKHPMIDPIIIYQRDLIFRRQTTEG